MRRMLLLFVLVVFAATVAEPATDLVTPTAAAAAGTATLRFTVSPSTVTPGTTVALHSINPCPSVSGTSSSSPAAVSLSFGYLYHGSYNFIQGWGVAQSPGGAWSSTWVMPALGPEADGASYGGGGDLSGQTVDILPGTYWFSATCLGPNGENGPSYGDYKTVTVTLRGTTVCRSDPTATPYQCGKDLALGVNRVATPISSSILGCTVFSCNKHNAATNLLSKGNAASELGAFYGNEQFAIGVVNNLTDTGLDDINQTFMWGGAHFTPTLIKYVEGLFASAYRTGRVTPAITGQLYREFSAPSAVARAAWAVQNPDKQLLQALEGNAVATTDFFHGLGGAEIEHWSQTDQGLFGNTGPIELLAIATISQNWQGYANYAQYHGALCLGESVPMCQGQLASIMYAATRNEFGLATVTNQIGPWFIAHGGRPSLTSATAFAEWIGELTNMNGHVASSTGAYLQNIQDWIWAGQFATQQVEVVAGGYALTEIGVGWLSAAAAGALRAGSFFDAYRAGLSLVDALNAVPSGEDVIQTASLIAKAEKVYTYVDGATNVVKVLEMIHSMKTTAGIKAELRYYFSIIGNTFHEAIARLIQEGLIVTSAGQVVHQQTSAEVDDVLAHGTTFFVQPSSTTPGVRFPVAFVGGMIQGIFESTH